MPAGPMQQVGLAASLQRRGGTQLSAPAAAGFGAMADVNAAAPRTEGEQIAQVAAGLASLDVRLPERGKMYLFTTPRGDIEITASAISASTLSRLSGLAAVLSAIFPCLVAQPRPVAPLWQSPGSIDHRRHQPCYPRLSLPDPWCFPVCEPFGDSLRPLYHIRSRLTPSLAAAI